MNPKKKKTSSQENTQRQKRAIPLSTSPLIRDPSPGIKKLATKGPAAFLGV
jgi:hypothetical protein